jgi:glycosyltransferase involved in cell wall biosynthesis
VSALLVPPRDPNALATALARLLDDTTLAVRLGAQGFEQVQHLTVDDYTATLLAIYRDLALRAGSLEARE